MSLKETNFCSSQREKLVWPNQLNTPKELMTAWRENTRLRIIKSPICSKIVLQFIGSWSYFLAHFMNKTRVLNKDVFDQELRTVEDQILQLEPRDIGNKRSSKSKKGPLLTFSNHISCIDDPILWACLLPLTYYSSNTDTVRWSAAAIEICFSKPWHSAFFSLGRTFPIIRGIGLEQPAMEFALGLMKHNQWLHLFPEGKVMRDNKQQRISNEERGYIFKWGISKLILDYFKDNLKTGNTLDNNTSIANDKVIRILPFYHLGLDEILPIGWPYIPRARKKISIYIKPSVIEMNATLLQNILVSRTLSNRQLVMAKSNDEITRIKLTNYLEEELERLAEPAEKFHQSEVD